MQGQHREGTCASFVRRLVRATQRSASRSLGSTVCLKSSKNFSAATRAKS